MSRAPLLVAIGLLLSPLAAQAQVAPSPAVAPARVDRPGFDLGLRLGYALPMGKVDNDDDLSDGVTGQIPLQIDALYRVNSQYAFGAYAAYGFAFVSDNICGPGTSCSGSVLRVGLQGTIRFSVPGTFIPWVGAGIGYEELKLKVSAGGLSQSVTVSGFELLNLQAGGEFLSSSDFAVGPFVSLSFGQYRSASGAVEMDIEDKGIHEWFQIGIRGLFSL
jgi:hypothetical protein